MNSGSFIADAFLIILYLLRGTDIYGGISLFFINTGYLYPCFMFYHMLKIPPKGSLTAADTNRDIVYRGYGDMKGISEIPGGNDFLFNINLRELFHFIGKRQCFHVVFFHHFNEFLTQTGIFGLPDFITQQCRTVKNKLAGFCGAQEFLRNFYNSGVLSVQPVYDRSIHVYSHNVNVQQRNMNVNTSTLINEART